MKSTCQSSPGICPGAGCIGNEGVGFRAPCDETEKQDNTRMSDLL